MSEIEAPRPEAEAAAPAPGFGRRLAAEREKLGLSVGDIAARLRLNPKQVQAIEDEALPALPVPFLRGFVRNYAKQVRLDPAPLVAELNLRLGPQPGEQEWAASGARASGGGGRSDQTSRHVVVVGVLVALVALAVVGWMATRADQRRVDAAAGAAKPVAVAPPAPATLPAPVAPMSAAETAQAAVVEAPTPTLEATQPGAAPTVASPAAAVAVDSLRLTFREQSWVEVTQADGRVVHSQINEPGTEQRIAGKRPLRLVIGNAPAVSLDFKGKSIDLKPVTTADNVARLTLE